VFVVVQFFRYVTFENAFSPIYQMFFAAIEKESAGGPNTAGWVCEATVNNSQWIDSDFDW
jgi:hypothetical protein